MGCIEHCRGLWYGASHGAVETSAGGMPRGTTQGTRGTGDTQDGVAATPGQAWHWGVPPNSILHPQAVPTPWGSCSPLHPGLGGARAEPVAPPHPLCVVPPPPSPAYCCNALDGRWYSYDDSRVEGVQEAEVSTRSAYILFYQRRNAVPAWSASSSIRGEHPHLPARLHPDSTRAPQSHRPGHTRHGRAHVQARGVRYTHVQPEPNACAFSMCTHSVGCAHRAQLHMHTCMWTCMHTRAWTVWQAHRHTA